MCARAAGAMPFTAGISAYRACVSKIPSFHPSFLPFLPPHHSVLRTNNHNLVEIEIFEGNLAELRKDEMEGLSSEEGRKDL